MLLDLRPRVQRIQARSSCVHEGCQYGIPVRVALINYSGDPLTTPPVTRDGTRPKSSWRWCRILTCPSAWQRIT